MKKIINLFLISLMFSCFALPVSAASFDITLQVQQPPNNIVSLALVEWTKKMKEESKGQLNITLAYNASITRTEGSYNGLKKGTVDMTLFPTSFNTTDLARAASLALPFLSKDAAHASRLLWKIYETMPEFRAELNKDVITLGMLPSAQNIILSTKSLVKSVNDLKGQRVIISAAGLGALEIQALGGNPIVTTASDTYIAIQRGMGDYAYAYVASVVPFKLEEVSKFGTVLSLNITPMYFGVNKFLWAELPEDLKTLLSSSIKEVCLEIGDKLQNDSNKQLDYIRSLGIEILVLDQENTQIFKESLLANKALMGYWNDMLTKGGISDPQAWIDQLYALSAATE